jgi:hypothetical protein
MRTRFQNYDDIEIYNNIQAAAGSETRKNFVVEFGKDRAEIALDIADDEIGPLLTDARSPELPVRWM